METMFWLIMIVIFVVAEIVTVGLTSIWFAGGALAALICSAIGFAPFWQILVFVAVSVIMLIFTRPWALKYLKPRLVKTNYESAIEQKVCLTERVDNIKGSGTAVLNGQEWTARAYKEGETFEAGEIVVVKEIRGVTMYVAECDDISNKSTKEEIQQ